MIDENLYLKNNYLFCVKSLTTEKIVKVLEFNFFLTSV